jgi:hypothetical protein
MPDFQMSMSEIFWHGALYERLFRLTKEHAETRDTVNTFRQQFKPVTDVIGYSTDPYETIETLAVECGLARHVELIPAGEHPHFRNSAEHHGEIPDDVVWSLADGTAASVEELEEIRDALDAKARAAFDACIEAGVVLDGLDTAEQFVESMNGDPVPVSRNLLERQLFRILDAHGPWAARGYARSTPDKLYFLNWLGEFERFTVSQQTSPQYAALLTRFNEHITLPPYMRISLIAQHVKNGGNVDDLIPAGWTPSLMAGASESVQNRSNAVGMFLDKLAHQYGETAEWRLGRFLALATQQSRVLENLTMRHRELLAERPCLPYVEIPDTTRDRVAAIGKDLLDWMQLCRQEAVGFSQEPSPEGLLADTRRRLSIDARFLLGCIIDDLRGAAEYLQDAGVPDAATAVSSACGVAMALKRDFRMWLSGGIEGAALEKSARQLSSLAGDAMTLMYGMLYLKELTCDRVFIDPASRVTIQRQPRAVREQIAEAISQYERQTLPNCTVTSACGLIEPIVRKMAAAWLPIREYRGDTADVLRLLLNHLIEEQRRLRAGQGEQSDPTNAERELKLKLYCVNLAFGLHHLGNSVRHHADMVLKRHDAGVMLHGLCAILQRL